MIRKMQGVGSWIISMIQEGRKDCGAHLFTIATGAGFSRNAKSSCHGFLAGHGNSWLKCWYKTCVICHTLLCRVVAKYLISIRIILLIGCFSKNRKLWFITYFGISEGHKSDDQRWWKKRLLGIMLNKRKWCRRRSAPISKCFQPY